MRGPLARAGPFFSISATCTRLIDWFARSFSPSSLNRTFVEETAREADEGSGMETQPSQGTRRAIKRPAGSGVIAIQVLVLLGALVVATVSNPWSHWDVAQLAVMLANLKEKHGISEDEDFQALASLASGIKSVASIELQSRAGDTLKAVDLQSVLDDLRIVKARDMTEPSDEVRSARNFSV